MARTNKFKPTEKQLADKKNRFPHSKTKEKNRIKQLVREVACY
jgi:hypothetical protein